MIALITEKDGKLSAKCLSEDTKIGDIYTDIENADKYAITHESVDLDPYHRWTTLERFMRDFKDKVIHDTSINFTEEQKKLMWDMLYAADRVFKLF